MKIKIPVKISFKLNNGDTLCKNEKQEGFNAEIEIEVICNKCTSNNISESNLGFCHCNSCGNEFEVDVDEIKKKYDCSMFKFNHDIPSNCHYTSKKYEL